MGPWQQIGHRTAVCYISSREGKGSRAGWELRRDWKQTISESKWKSNSKYNTQCNCIVPATVMLAFSECLFETKDRNSEL